MEESNENCAADSKDENKVNRMFHSNSELEESEPCQTLKQETRSLFSTTFNLDPSDRQNSLFSRHPSLFRTLYLRREFKLINELRWDMIQRSTYRKSNNKDNSDNIYNDNLNINKNDVILLPFSHMPPSQEPGKNNKYSEKQSKRESSYFAPREGNQRQLEEEEYEEEEEKWYGFIFVNDKRSPWYEGVFQFLVHFPPSYPFACPRIELTGAFPSHPWVTIITGSSIIDGNDSGNELKSETEQQELELKEEYAEHQNNNNKMNMNEREQEAMDSNAPPTQARESLLSSHQNRSYTHYIIPFEHIYNKLEPMKTSVMSAMCAYISDFFSFVNQVNPLQDDSNSNVIIDRSLARHDVQRRSITQEILLGSSYAHLVENVMTPFFLQQGNTIANQCTQFVTDQSTESTFAQWYTNVVLPQLHQMQ